MARASQRAKNKYPLKPEKARFTPQQAASSLPGRTSTPFAPGSTRKYCSPPVLGKSKTSPRPKPQNRRRPGSPHSKKREPRQPDRQCESTAAQPESTSSFPFWKTEPQLHPLLSAISSLDPNALAVKMGLEQPLRKKSGNQPTFTARPKILPPPADTSPAPRTPASVRSPQKT